MMNRTSIRQFDFSRLTAFQHWHEVLLGAMLLGGLLLAGVLEPRFVRPSVQLELVGETWTMAIVALPMAMIIITAGIDLSVGAMTCLSAVVLGLTLNAGFGIPIAVALALLTGALAGLINGCLIAGLGIHPLIVTLATMAGFRGIAMAITEGQTIQGFPEAFGPLFHGKLLGIPLPMWGFVCAAISVGFFLQRTAYGRFLYAMGHNETAARYSGVPVTKIKVSLYLLSGIACGVGAILLASRYEQAKADFASNLELEVITAVVLGGVSIFGGRGNIGGVVLGLALLHVCNRFVPWHWHVSELTSLVTGGLLIASVLLNALFTRQRN